MKKKYSALPKGRAGEALTKELTHQLESVE